MGEKPGNPTSDRPELAPMEVSAIPIADRLVNPPPEDSNGGSAKTEAGGHPDGSWPHDDVSGRERLDDVSDGRIDGDSSENDTYSDDSIVKLPENLVSGGDSDISGGKTNGYHHVNGGDKWRGERQEELVGPPSHLPQPEAPPGLTNSISKGGEDFHPIERTLSANGAAPVDVSAIGKYIRDRGNTLSAAIVKRISSLKEQDESQPPAVTEFHLSGLKVIVQVKEDDKGEEEHHRTNGRDILELKGRISFFSRSNCRDCGAVRSFFREKGLRYVEINVDVFPSREKELIERAGSASVPQIFFNEKLLGGLVVLNSLRNSGEFEKRLRETAGGRCPDVAPKVPVYGFDDDEDELGGAGERTDAMVGIVRVIRQKLPIQDRLMKMKIVKNCFAGSDLVEAIINHLDCGRKKV